nr:MAG TPA: hypothetical protein [Inoviridae sp.]
MSSLFLIFLYVNLKSVIKIALPNIRHKIFLNLFCSDSGKITLHC